MQQDFEFLEECTDPEQIKIVTKRMFDLLDTDLSGFIEPDEIATLFRKIAVSRIAEIVAMYAHLLT
jgi:hypothetical protein